MKNNKFLYCIVICMIAFIIINLYYISECKFEIRILKNRINNFEEYIEINNNKKFAHFSIDDTIEIFNDLTKNENNYKSIFENDFLNFLKQCNELFGANFSLYCFNEYKGISLSNCTEKFRKEFEENSNWLKFGFHGYNEKVNYSSIMSGDATKQYEKTISNLIRIVGEKSITNVVRLEKFLCSKENIDTLKNCKFGIKGLLASDSLNRINYYLNGSTNKKLFDDGYYFDDTNSIFLYKTDLRIENIDNVKEEVLKNLYDNNLIIFTHEDFLNVENKKKIFEICKLLTENGYIFSFPDAYMEE